MFPYNRIKYNLMLIPYNFWSLKIEKENVGSYKPHEGYRNEVTENIWPWWPLAELTAVLSLDRSTNTVAYYEKQNRYISISETKQ